MTELCERFEFLYGPTSPNRPDLPAYLRAQVYGRMHYMLEDNAADVDTKRKRFRSAFHPDRPGIFNRDECEAVFKTIPHIFDGAEL